MKDNLSRRSFLASALAAGSAPFLLSGCAASFLACRKINIGVIGYGRIGKLLAQRLRALGALVTVSARRSAESPNARWEKTCEARTTWR